MKFCSQCGREAKEGASFCSGCGTGLAALPEPIEGPSGPVAGTDTPPDKLPRPSHESTSVNERESSPTWYSALMYGFLALGALIIVTNYVGILPAGTSNKYLIGGLVLAGIGMVLGVASAASPLISRKSATAEPPSADPALSTSLTRASVDEHYVERESTNPFATASLVLSLVGFIAGIGAILGVIFGYIALSQIKKSGQGGRGLALAGVIIGWIEIAAAIGLVVWVFANL